MDSKLESANKISKTKLVFSIRRNYANRRIKKASLQNRRRYA